MTEIESAIVAGQQIAEPKTIGHGAYAVVPKDSRIEDLERFMPKPTRIRAHVKTHDPSSFCLYFNRFKAAGSTVFASREKFLVIGMLDYPETQDSPEFREHTVDYTAPLSPEWMIWTKRDGTLIPQGEFAQFIEDNVVDIRLPPGADMLEMARTFEAKHNVDFASAVRLDSGQRQFSYVETISGSAAKGTITVPEIFRLGIPVFIGGPLYEVTARFRYRINGGKLLLGYEFYRREAIERDAFAELIERISKDTETDVILGAP